MNSPVERAYVGFSTVASWENRQVRTRDLVRLSEGNRVWDKEPDMQILSPESPSSKSTAQTRWSKASTRHLSILVPATQSTAEKLGLRYKGLTAFVTAFESIAEMVGVDSGL